MIIVKKIKPSKRGLTFSFDGVEKFKPGAKYRYVLDKKNNSLLILPANDDGSLIVSRKKGKKIKSLVDLRNKEVIAIMQKADFLEVEIREERILVVAYAETNMEQVQESSKVISIAQYAEPIMSYRISKRAAGGNEGFYQLRLQDFYDGFSEKTGNEISKEIRTDLPNVLRVISLFSGAGMLDLPFSKDSDFSIVYAGEHDKDALRTYQHNVGNHIHNVDIRNLKGAELPEADIIIGGCPCQPYSKANPSSIKRGKAHEEGDLLQEFVRLIHETKITLFLIENVQEFLTDKYGENMEYIKTQLSDYQISAKVIMDSNVGGYTKRKRAFILGSRLGTITIPDLVLRPVKTVGQALSKVNESWHNYNDISTPSPKTQMRISLVPEGGNWRDLPTELHTKGVHSNMYRRLDRNQPSVTICNWRKYLLSPPRYDNSGKWDRILSVAEAAALSGLDEKFVFQGKLSSKQQQVGNGVPFALANFIKNVIKNVFTGKMALCKV